IDLRFSPKAFAATHLQAGAQERPALTPSIPAAFLNYDLSHTSQAIRGLPGTRELGALTELGFSNDLGVLTSSYAGTGLLHSDPAVDRRWRRLETTWTRDLPQDNLTVRVGDSSTRAGIGGRSVYFGGLQLGRNFGLTPGFLSQPIPTISGTSSAPSTVELYVNDALRQTSRVPTGPFAIDNFPLFTGSGQARVVVRDLLGRETVLVQDFFTHSALLGPGLSDWSVALGAVRHNLGTLNADYGQRFTSGLYRYGLSSSSTLEARTEFGQQTRGAALALSQALPGQMLGQLALAASRDADVGSGAQLTAGLEHHSLRHGFTARMEGASAGYRQVGQDALAMPTRMQLSASYNYAHPQWGNLGLGLARLDNHGTAPITTYNLNYSAKLGERSSLAVTLTRVSGSTSATALAVSLMIPMDGALTSFSNLTVRDGKADAYTAVNKSLAQETGTGWRALAGTRDDGAFSEAGAYYQGGKGMLTADLSASSAQQTLRLGARGGLAMADGRLLAARRIENSFAIVEVPGYAGIGVGFQGSSLTKTDASGIAILPQLNPYSRNSIRLDPRELPISAEIDNIEQIAVPAARSAVKVVFPVRSGRAALIKLVLDDGEPAPAGAEVELVGDKHEFFVARR
ncbi:MAG TPA: fimbria/pilus outer membrane usher protein, partial [Ramlibacter sp.]|nr:fimbria/pilus outer membrane usher protein [Ramlibacter sp.]